MGFLERAIRRGVSDAVEQYRQLLLEGGFYYKPDKKSFGLKGLFGI